MEHMVTIPILSEIDKPQPGEDSRTKPDQVGNVAGATSDELQKRILRSGPRETMGPLDHVYAFWLSGMSCDGCTISASGATEPSLDELLSGALPGVPMLFLHHYVLNMESGDHFTASLEKAEKGELDAPYVVVYEGSIPDENLTVYGEPWAAEGAAPLWAPEEERRRIPTSEWVRRLAPGAAAVIAIGTCATWGGIPAAEGNATGAMAVSDFLGKDYRSSFGLPVINIPGCAPLGDNFTETVAMTLLFLNGQAPLPEFDELGRPEWLLGDTVHRHCPRAGWYEEGIFAKEYGDKECLVEIGCWGPVVNCNITERGAVGHMGGCMAAGGVCIGCTMPGFPDKFTPFYKRPPGSTVSTTASRLVGSFVRPMRRITQWERNRTPRWRGYVPNLRTITNAAMSGAPMPWKGRATSGWAAQYEDVSLTHKIVEYFYMKLQYFRSEFPGRQKPVERYRSGYKTPAEEAYGPDYQVLPDVRARIAKARGQVQREGLTPQAEGFDKPPMEV